MEGTHKAAQRREGENKCQLVFECIGVDDQGEFMCRAENEHGFATTWAEVIVESKPENLVYCAPIVHKSAVPTINQNVESFIQISQKNTKQTELKTVKTQPPRKPEGDKKPLEIKPTPQEMKTKPQEAVKPVFAALKPSKDGTPVDDSSKAPPKKLTLPKSKKIESAKKLLTEQKSETQQKVLLKKKSLDVTETKGLKPLPKTTTNSLFKGKAALTEVTKASEPDSKRAAEAENSSVMNFLKDIKPGLK